MLPLPIKNVSKGLKKKEIATLFVSFLLFFSLIRYSEAACTQATITSVKAGNFNSASTWNLGRVPNTCDNIVINHAVVLNAEFLLGNDAKGQITIGTSGQLTGSSKLRISNNSSSLTNNGTLNLSNFEFGFNFSDSAYFYNNAAATFSGNVYFKKGGIRNNGTFTVSNNIAVFENVTFRNYENKTITFGNNTHLNMGAVLINQGTANFNSTSVDALNLNTGQLYNYGTVTINGTLNLASGPTNTNLNNVYNYSTITSREVYLNNGSKLSNWDTFICTNKFDLSSGKVINYPCAYIEQATAGQLFEVKNTNSFLTNNGYIKVLGDFNTEGYIDGAGTFHIYGYSSTRNQALMSGALCVFDFTKTNAAKILDSYNANNIANTVSACANAGAPVCNTAGTAQTNAVACTDTDACFDFSYLGFVRNANNTVTLNFGVKTNCGNDLSHVAFELPAGVTGSNLKNANTAFGYTFENPTNTPFYSLKFEASSVSGYKNGVSDVFSYTIPATSFDNMTTMRVQAKAAGSIGTVTFNTKGCCVNSTTISGPAQVCANTTQTYSVAAIPGISTYSWIVPTGWTINSGQGTNTISVTSNAQPGDVKVQQGFATCGTKTVSIISPVPTPGTITGTSPVCNGITYTYSVPAVTGATYYNWTVPAGWQIVSSPVGNGYGNSISVKAGTTNGNITAAAVGSCNTSVAVSKSLTVTPNVTAPLTISGDASVCVNNTYTYSVAAVTNATYYNWTVPTGWQILSTPVGNGYGNAISVKAGNTSGDITVAAGNTCGESGSITKSVIVTPALTSPGSVSGNSTVCSTVNYTYEVAAVVGASYYEWTVPNGWQITSTAVGNGFDRIISVKAGTSNGNITVKAVNACSSSALTTLPVTVTPQISAPTAITGDASVCPTGTYTYSVSPIAGATYYIWTVPAGWQILSAAVGNGYGNSISVKAGSSGGSVTVAAVNACNTSAAISRTVGVEAPITLSGVIDGLTIVCSSNIYTYSVNAVAGAAYYNWVLPVGWQMISTPTGNGYANSVMVQAGSNGGVIQVSAVSPCGIETQALTLATQVELPVSINGTITGNLNPLAGSTQTYTVATTNAAFLNWSVGADNTILSGQGTNTITVKINSTSGTISVLAQSQNGCSSATTSIWFTAASGVNLTVLLEGPYNATTGLMATALNSGNLLPLNQPFNTTAWKYYGTESVSAGFFAANPTIVDWVLVELRTGLLPSSRVAIKACFLKNNGTLLDLNGVNFPSFPQVANGSYYMIIHQRNHLSIMSSGLVPLTNNSGNYDFTTSSMKAYGTMALKRMANGKYAMYTGDANADGTVSTSDWNINWTAEKNKTGYLSSDWDLNGIVNTTDYNLWKANGAQTTQVIR